MLQPSIDHEDYRCEDGRFPVRVRELRDNFKPQFAFQQ